MKKRRYIRKRHKRYSRGKPTISNGKIYYSGKVAGLASKLVDPLLQLVAYNNGCQKKKIYVMRDLNTPKRVTLPNGRTFLARYKRVSRSELPAHIRLGRTYTGRPARVPHKRGQRGAGLISSLKKIAKSPLVKLLVKTGVNHLPSSYNSATNRIKNEKVREALKSEIAQEAVSKIVKKYGGE